MVVSDATIAIRIPQKIKKEAMKVAEDLGISLSTVVATYLKKFIIEKHILIGDPTDHISYYENNDKYIKIDKSAEDVVAFLHNQKKR